MRLVACPSCHTQYDVTNVSEESFTCRCGGEVENRDLRSVDATILRCGSCGAIVGAKAEVCDYCSSPICPDESSLSLICPECYGRNRDESRFCTACGVAFDPQTAGERDPELPCPDCGCLMPTQRIGGVGASECRQCNGLWVPEERFELLVSKAIEARETAPAERLAQLSRPRVKGDNPAAQAIRYRRCPVCEAFMLRKNFRKTSGVIVDVCREHGTWLDSDELERIAGFILSGGRPKASEFMRQTEQDAERSYQEARAAHVAVEGSSAARSLGQPFRAGPARSSSSSFVHFLVDLLT